MTPTYSTAEAVKPSPGKSKNAYRHTIQLFRDATRRAAPPPALTITEWADANRYLSSDSAAEPGKYRSSRTPYAREIMDAVSDPGTETVVLMTSAQVGKTTILENIIGYYIEYDPSPILVVMPDLAAAKMFSEERLSCMLQDTPALRGTVKEARTRDSDNTKFHKRFPGGHITMVGSHAPAGLRARPVRILLCDEVDAYPASAGTEGDPVSLARKRTRAFWNRKIVLTSTPTEQGLSRIEKAYAASTQEIWSLPCPSCGEYQPLLWEQIDPETATHSCVSCGACHGEAEWKSGEGKWLVRNPGARARGFHLNEFSSPWSTWVEVIEGYREAEAAERTGDTEIIKTWWNTTLGLPYEDRGEHPDEDLLEQRRHEYHADVPAAVRVLTAAVDVQDNRLECEVVGWGPGRESWGIEYRVLPGSPGQTQVWSDLDRFLMGTWHKPDGSLLALSCTCIDSGGHFTQETYDFTRPRQGRRVFSIKGQGGPGIPLIGKPSMVGRKQTPLFIIGVDGGKELVYSRLKVKHEGPGYCHFPRETTFDNGVFRGYDNDYYKGITSERRVIRYQTGSPVIKWEKPRRAKNEPLDIRVYATAALEILNPKLDAPQTQPAPPVSTLPRRRMISRGIQ